MAQLEPHYAGIAKDALELPPRQSLHIVLDNIRSAYNVGSMFRTADACAAAHIHLCGMSAHPPHRKIDKTSLGAHDYVPWTYHERTSSALEALREQGIPIVAVEVTDSAAPYTAFEWPRPVAVVFGNEVTGINAKCLAKCDAAVCIPMAGYKNSLNVATAFGIILFGVLQAWEALPRAGAPWNGVSGALCDVAEGRP